MKKGVETHRWGFFNIGDGRLIASCVADTYHEAQGYFEGIDLPLDLLHEIRIIATK